jgi:hypothetical protein
LRLGFGSILFKVGEPKLKLFEAARRFWRSAPCVR